MDGDGWRCGGDVDTMWMDDVDGRCGWTMWMDDVDGRFGWTMWMYDVMYDVDVQCGCQCDRRWMGGRCCG
jgi:hypothetical protein